MVECGALWMLLPSAPRPGTSTCRGRMWGGRSAVASVGCDLRLVLVQHLQMLSVAMYFVTW